MSAGAVQLFTRGGGVGSGHEVAKLGQPFHEDFELFVVGGSADVRVPVSTGATLARQRCSASAAPIKVSTKAHLRRAGAARRPLNAVGPCRQAQEEEDEDEDEDDEDGEEDEDEDDEGESEEEDEEEEEETTRCRWRHPPWRPSCAARRPARNPAVARPQGPASRSAKGSRA